MKKRAVKPTKPGTTNVSEADADAFAREMADVIPLPRDRRGRIKEHLPVVLPAAETPRAGGRGVLDEPDDDFAAPGIDRREIRKLKRGDYQVTGRRDLHGVTTTEALASVRRFVDNSRHTGHRCICIVHGRGLHSEGGVAILKARVRECLRTHPAVLAYADAPRADGGPGAVYVLLRR
jgi:DNA-nicking Smr family endonuclease